MSTLTFNGVDLADYGVHISGEGTFNAPNRAVEEQIVPGRNGTLIIDGGRWENIIVTYPAYITDDFDDNMAALRGFLASVRGYARLADTYHPNEFRLACFSDEITVKTSGRYNAQGQFDLSFNCKPQRFLKSGEETITFDASDLPSESFSGNPATFETDGEYKVSELSVGITPVQSGSGDPSPDNIRPISGRTGITVERTGKNLLSLPYAEASKTQNGITFTVNADGSIRVAGTATGTATLILVNTAALNELPFLGSDATVTLSGCPSGGSSSTYYMTANLAGDNTGDVGAANLLDTGAGDTKYYTNTHVKSNGNLFIRVMSGTTIDKVFYPMFALADSVTEWQSPTVNQTIPITWESIAGTVYGGTLDVVSGVLTVDSYLFIPTASDVIALSGRYALSTPNRPTDTHVDADPVGLYCNRLPSVRRRTIINEDVYGISYDTGVDRVQIGLQGLTTAAEAKAWLADNPLQIVYKLATPQTCQLTPTEVRTILGVNNLLSDAGDSITGKYLLPLEVENPTLFEAKPIIRIYGAGTVGIGDVNVTFDGSSEYVDLDCELQDAYYGPANKNSSVTLDPNRFPVIPASGVGIVLGSGITQVDITPRWFEL